MNGSVQAINIVFDGPPAPEGGRFVEVGTDDGHSISIGQWLERSDGYCALRIGNVPIPSPDAINRPPRRPTMTPNRKPPRPADDGPGLPPDLAGPVELELAKAAEQLPARTAYPAAHATS